MTDLSPVPFDGHVDPAFAAVGDAFRANFAPSDAGVSDLGAALAVVAGGRLVVDCWGGWRDLAAKEPWERDTLVNAYSVGKPIAALVSLTHVASGNLALDAPLVDVWPEMREHHATTTLRQALAHQAGLPGARPVLTDADALSWDRMCAALATSEPWWEPGTAHGYHVNTFGFLAGEPVRRATGRSYAQALRERITGPLGLDLHCGLGDEEITRAAEVDTHDLPPPTEADLARAPTDEAGRMVLHAYFNPASLSGIGSINRPEWRRAMIPSTNTHATARAVAGLYASLLPGAAEPLLPAELLAEATSTQAEGHDLVLDRPSRFGLGFGLHQAVRRIGVTPSAFGHYGHGGSLGFADPDAGIAFCYLVNRTGDRWQDHRTKALLEALRTCC